MSPTVDESLEALKAAAWCYPGHLAQFAVLTAAAEALAKDMPDAVKVVDPGPDRFTVHAAGRRVLVIHRLPIPLEKSDGDEWSEVKAIVLDRISGRTMEEGRLVKFNRNGDVRLGDDQQTYKLKVRGMQIVAHLLGF